MNDAHWHLMLNHFPVIGTIFSLIVLVAAQILKDASIRKAGLWLFVLTALLTIPAYLTGEGAEEVVENLSQGIGKIIHKHEEWGEKVLITCLLSGLLSAVALWGEMAKKSFVRILVPVIIVFALANTVLLKYTATSGGKISHKELRGGNGDKLNKNKGNGEPANAGEPAETDELEDEGN